jgi:hypothetical protein
VAKRARRTPDSAARPPTFSSAAMPARKALAAALAALLISCGGYVAFAAWRSAAAQTTFSALLQRLDASHVAFVADSGRRDGNDAIIVVVRDVIGGASGNRTPYGVKTGLFWSVPFATAPAGVTMILLVDRIRLDIRSYRPYGDDYQVILHCRLIDVAQQRIFADFTTKGSMPWNRSGLFKVSGLFDGLGSEPWSDVGRQVEVRLARR